MAITKGAKEGTPQLTKEAHLQRTTKVVLHDTVKSFNDHIRTGNTKDAAALLPTVYKALDKAAKRGVIKPNTASRRKSRLAQKLGKKA